MLVTLDLTQLLAQGEITKSEYDKLLRLSSTQTGSLAFNVLIAFGVIAISGGVLALFPSAETCIVLGLGIGAAGIFLGTSSPERWKVLANVSTLVGALLLGGGIIKIAEGSSASFLLVTAIFLLAGVAARSGLLVALSILSLSSSTGARTEYFHATYCLGIEEPAVTVALFTTIAIGTFLLSERLPFDLKRLAIIASRTSVFVVNFGFWIGSLWGDRNFAGDVLIEDEVFIIGWALALFATGIWGARRNRRWVVNTVAVFAGIHLYTQWFEHFGASPGTIVIAGIMAIAGALALKSYNHRLRAESVGN